MTWTDTQYDVSWVRASCNGGAGANPTPIPQAYDAKRNPKGARCSLFDNEVNVWGRDPKTGFARRPLDNVGVQYGLVAFNAGKINAEQFVELNEKVGGFDIDGNIVSARMVGDPEALRIAYQSGLVDTGGGGLGSVPIIDVRTYGDMLPDIHDSKYSFMTRARLKAANGNADNQVIQIAPPQGPLWTNLGAGPIYKQLVWDNVVLMDRWLDAIKADNSSMPLAAKIARNKPADLADACWTEDGQKITGPGVYDKTGRCSQLYPLHTDPRIAAGGPLTDDVLKCALKPIAAKDYAQPVNADQMNRLKAVFAKGVCDYSRPGVGQQVTRATWQRWPGQAETAKAGSN